MSFWQSRNRYKSSDIALSIADRYQKLQLANYVGVLVIGRVQQAITSCNTPRTIPRAMPHMTMIIGCWY